MRLTQLHQFLAVAEAGSIRAAARALGISHPAMAKSLRLLEGEAGIPLLRRSTRGVVCTDAGRVLLARARAIGAEVRKAEEELAQLAAPGSGTVSVGLSGIALMISPDAIARFIQNHPAARLRIMEGPTSVLVPLVRDQTLDFAVAVKMAATTGPGLRFRVLHSVRMAIAARRGHPLRGARSLRELADACWLGLNAPGGGGWLEHAFTAAGLAFPRRYVHCESFAFGFELLSRTDAVMFVAAPVLAEPLKRGLLAEIPLDAPLPPVDIGLFTRADTRLTPLATTLARAVADSARRLPRAK